MIVTKKHSGRVWFMAVLVIAAAALVFFGSTAQEAYAANKAPDTALQPNPANQPEPEVAPTTLTVTLLDEDGAPIRGVGLSIITADFTSRQKGSAVTDKNGKVVYSNLKSGAYYLWANINALRRHDGYGLPAMIREFKSATSYYISESRRFDLSENVETTFTIKRSEFIWFETYLQVVRSGKIVVMNRKTGLQQIIPVASSDYLQIYLPMRSLYQIVTIKNDDFDSWIMEFWAHERLRIELL